MFPGARPEDPGGRRCNFSSQERDQKIREGKTQIFDALRDVNGGKVTLRPSFPYDSVYCGPYAPGSYIPISTVGLSGVDLLESMPTQMVKLLTNISHLQFNTKPDYEFMRNCFLQLEVQGDTEGFRRKFGAVTRYEAIAKEILGVDWNERSWNTSRAAWCFVVILSVRPPHDTARRCTDKYSCRHDVFLQDSYDTIRSGVFITLRTVISKRTCIPGGSWVLPSCSSSCSSSSSPVTTDETPKQPVKRKRAREPEVVEEPPAPSPSPHLHAVLNNAFTPLQPRKLAAADSPGYDPPPSIGRTPPPPLSMPPQGGATSSSGAELGGTAGRTSSTKNAGTMGSMNNNGGGTAGTTVAGLTVGQSTTAGIFWGSFLQDHVPPRPPDAAALLQTQQEPALKRVRKDTPLPTSAKMGGILKRTKKAEK